MRVLIAAGGTAGHINPALAIAGALKKADPTAEIHFAGRKEGMEYRLVTQAGYPFHHIEITGFQRKLSLHNIKRNLITLWNLALSGPTARKMMREAQPDLVIGCGGYVSGPVVRCAAKMGIKTALHEQNAFPGVTNKLLAPDVDIVFAAVPAAVEKLGAPEKTRVVGNPVRPEVFAQAGNRDAIRAELGAGDRTVILSFGGSLGARRVNEVVADLCAWEQKNQKPVLHLHATGQYGVELFQNLEKEKGFAPGDSLVVKEYINNMPELLAAADLVISRAGALTLAELEAVGRAAVLIPSPNVAENHQYYNAMELQKAGAAVVIEEKDLTGEALVATVADLLAEEHVPVVSGPYMTDRSKPEIKNLTDEAPGILAKAGIPTAITVDHPEIPLRLLPVAVMLAVRAGMDKTDALRAVTAVPAKIAGLSDRIGSLRAGLDADCVLWSGDPLDIATQVKAVFVNGTPEYRRTR